MKKQIKDKFVKIRVTPEQKARYKAKAESEGFENLSEWMRVTLKHHTAKDVQKMLK